MEYGVKRIGVLLVFELHIILGTAFNDKSQKTFEILYAANFRAVIATLISFSV